MPDEKTTTGAWVITKVYSVHGIPIDVKSSGSNTVAAIDDLYTGVAHGIEKYGWQLEAPKAPQAPAPNPDPAARIALEAGNKNMAQEMQAEYETVPPAPNGTQWETVDITEIHIEPKADGMVSVEFWQTGRKYAEEYVKWKPENIKGLLKHIMTVPTNDDGSIKPSVLACKCRVYYTLGKEKTGPNAKPGSRWHDVAHVRSLAA